MFSESIWQHKIEELYKLFDPCRLCPRKCGAKRLSGQIGFCGAGNQYRIASWAAHRGEEPPISGTRGSGTLFASHCPMKCQFCQNFPFSQLGNGKDVTPEELAKSIIQLTRKGVHNINLVTNTQFLPQVFDALIRAWAQVPALPIVYNSSGYESLDILRILEGMVDIYLPDIRYADNAVAAKYSKAPDYVEHDRASILEMFRQTGPLQIDQDEIGIRGLIVRHLILPERLAGTRESLTWLRDTLGTKVHLSMMNQFFPAHRALDYPELSRKITDEEYLEALDLVEDLGFENVWAQDPELPGFA